MRIIPLFLIFLFSFVNVAQAQTPPEDFLRQQLLVPYPGPISRAVAPQTTGLTVGAFVANLRKGEWEPDEHGSWIYRIKTADKLTGRTREFAFMLAPQLTGVLFDRAAVNGEEIPSGQIMVFFMQIMNKPVAEPPQKAP